MGYGKPVNLHSQVKVILPRQYLFTRPLGSNTWDTEKIHAILEVFAQIVKRIEPEFQPVTYWHSSETMVYTFDIYYPANIYVESEQLFEQILRELENKFAIRFFKETEFYDVLDDVDTDPCPNVNPETLGRWHRCDLCQETPSRVIRISKQNLDKLLVNA